MDQGKERFWPYTGTPFHFGRWDRARWWLISPGRLESFCWIAGFLFLVVMTGALLAMVLWNVGWLPVFF